MRQRYTKTNSAAQEKLQRVYDQIRDRGGMSKADFLTLLGSHCKSADSALAQFDSLGLLLSEDAGKIYAFIAFE